MIEPTISVYAAGSLRTVLPALVAAFTEMTGTKVSVQHGPAGLLRERIEQGDRPDLFLSANFAHPHRLSEQGLSLPPILFARNRMVALARRQARITSANFIDRMLDPATRIATSTPINDPSGDYAWAIFRRIEDKRPGAFMLLDAKAHKLVGGSMPSAVPTAYEPVAQALSGGTADLFLGYVTGLGALATRLADVDVIDIPDEVNVVPEYGLAVMKNASLPAHAFVLFVMSGEGQRLLHEHGFAPVALPQN